MKIKRAYNVQIWVGLKEHYCDRTIHTMDDVRQICDNYVNNVQYCVTITPTEFRYVNGHEPGVIVGLIQYPRFPKTRKQIRKQAIILGSELMSQLKQYRMTITTPFKSYMLENQGLKYR